jgi:hypothetical protein
MPSKIYHKDQGFVLTSDDTEIKDILKRGGIDCTNKPNDYIRRLIHPEFYTAEINQEETVLEPTLSTEETTVEPKRRGRPRVN